ncbi:toll/interleukin-1 receptor domain-containing protein [bacterium SCSIO 12696]|nr:toll/interleukin-1 receptor domain-containing protein [bacterium SCSIO 12696]
MSTKVFISWSGDLSRQLAEAVRNWLPGVLQYVKPYFTPDDIEKGTKWSTEIINNLEGSEIGIICLTKDNLNKPWILFEAGALSKNFGKSKVCTLLFGIDSSDLTGPLTGFQDTKFNKTDFKKMIESINKEGGDSKLDSKVLDQVFDMWWGKLEEEVNGILSGHKENDQSPTRSDRELLEEVLELARMNASRPMKRAKMSRSVIYDLIEVIEEISHVSMKYGDKRSFMLMERLRRPIKHLCMELDEPKLYKEFMYRMERFPEQRFLLDETEQENPADR